MKLRRAGPADIDTVLALMQELYTHEDIAFVREPAAAALKRLLADDGPGLVLLLEGDAGYAVLTAGYSLEFHGGFGLLDELYVREEQRGTGAGRAALEALEAACRERGWKALRLEVGHENSRALALYRRTGFREEQRFLMTKWL